jgi:hypothetical protein
MRIQSKIFSLGLESELDGCEKALEPWETQLQANPPIVLYTEHMDGAATDEGVTQSGK